MARAPQGYDVGRLTPTNNRSLVPYNPQSSTGTAALAHGFRVAADAVYSVDRRNREHAADLYVTEAEAEARKYWLEEKRRREKSAEDPANYTKTFGQDFDAYADATIEKAPDQETRRRLQISFRRMGSALHADALAFEDGLFTARAKTALTELLDTEANTVRGDPSRINDAAANMARYLTQSRDKGFFTALEVQELSKAGGQLLTKSAIMGRLEAGDVRAVEKEVGAGEWDKALSASDKNALLAEITKYGREADRQDIAEKIVTDPKAAVQAIEAEQYPHLTAAQTQMYLGRAYKQIGADAAKRALDWLETPDAVDAAVATVEGKAPPRAQRRPAVGVPADYVSAARAEAEASGVSVAYIIGLGGVETGGKFNTDATSPSGLHGGIAQASDAVAGAYNADRWTAAGAARIAAGYAKDNKLYLEGVLGRSVKDRELYLAHQQGPGGSSALLSAAPGALAIDALAGAYGGDRGKAKAAIEQNGGSIAMTASEFAQLQMQKFDARLDMHMPKSVGASPLSDPDLEYASSSDLNAISKRMEAVVESARLSHRVQLAESGRQPFSDRSTDDRKDRDAFWPVFADQLGVDQSDMAQVRDAGLMFASTYGSLPEPVIERVEQGLNSGATEDIFAAAEALYAMGSEGWERVGDSNEKFARLVVGLRGRGGLSADEAVTMANDRLRAMDQDEADARIAMVKAGGDKSILAKYSKEFVDSIPGVSKVDRGDVPSIQYAGAQQAFEEAFLSAQASMGDPEAAYEYAHERVSRVWSVSAVAGGERLMRGAPEKFFAASPEDDPDDTREWQQEQLLTDLAGYFPPGTFQATQRPADDPDTAPFVRALTAGRRREVLERVHLEPIYGQGSVQPAGYRVFIDGELLLDFRDQGDVGLYEDGFDAGSVVVWTPNYLETPQYRKLVAEAAADMAQNKKDAAASRASRAKGLEIETRRRTEQREALKRVAPRAPERGAVDTWPAGSVDIRPQRAPAGSYPVGPMINPPGSYPVGPMINPPGSIRIRPRPTE